jgi:hypothetical protein
LRTNSASVLSIARKLSRLCWILRVDRPFAFLPNSAGVGSVCAPHVAISPSDKAHSMRAQGNRPAVGRHNKGYSVTWPRLPGVSAGPTGKSANASDHAMESSLESVRESAGLLHGT